MNSANAIQFDNTTGKATVRDTDCFPEALYELADRIQILDMSTVPLKTLPANMYKFSQLRVAFFSNNPAVETFPEELAGCGKLETIGMRGCSLRAIPEHSLPPNLRALTLTDNKIEALPRSIGDCKHLQKIMIAGNQLTSLPQELLRCQKLEIVRFSVNRLSKAPEWLLELPNLAWYNDASNPGSLRSNGASTEINWSDIELGEELGRSVNNITYRGKLRNGQDIAVKVYGNALVTDGLATDDMAACLRAGVHPNVVGGIGRVMNAPQGKPALAMPLIDSSFVNLGRPPSLDSVCRDTYDTGQTFSVMFVLKVAQTVAAGMRHLHSLGIMHGDLYAHNILTDATGNSLVGDFGAASFYEPGSDVGKQLERVDVRAFGILINELVSRSTHNEARGNFTDLLRSLANDCSQPAVLERPSFAEISRRLELWSAS